MNKYISVMLLILLPLYIIVAANPKNDTLFLNTLKTLTPKGGKFDKKFITLTKEQLKEINKKYNSTYKTNDTFTIYTIKKSDTKIESYVLQLKRTIEEFESVHSLLFQFEPNKTTLREVKILELNDDYAKLVQKSPVFLKQFKNVLNINKLEVGKTVDAVTEATMTSELIVEAVKIASYILNSKK